MAYTVYFFYTNFALPNVCIEKQLNARLIAKAFTQQQKEWIFTNNSQGITANEGRSESNINAWYRFMYFQKRKCTASLFPEQNYNILSPSFHMYLWVIYIYSQIHECRNWDWGCAVSFLEIHKSDIRCSEET